MRFTLRLEPYDPDARDGDNDGIVQEGTAWERPAGTRIVDKLGKELKRGLTSPYRNSTFKIIGYDGKNVDYLPSYGKDADFDPKNPKATLEKLGYSTIESLNLPTVKDMILPSTRSEADAPELPTPALQQVAEDAPLSVVAQRQADRLEASKLAGIRWTPDRVKTQVTEEELKTNISSVSERLSDHSQTVIEKPTLESHGIVRVGRLGLMDTETQKKVNFSQLTPEQRIAYVRDSIVQSGDEDRLRQFDDLIRALASASPEEREEIVKQTLLEIGEKIDRRTSIVTSGTAVESILETGIYKTVHDPDARGFGFFGDESKRQIRRNAETTNYGIPDLLPDGTDPVEGLRPVSGELIHSPINETHASRMRELYGDDVDILYSVSFGADAKFSKATSSSELGYDRGEQARVILRPEVSSRTRFHYGDGISDGGSNYAMDDLDQPETVAFYLGGRSLDSADIFAYRFMTGSELIEYREDFEGSFRLYRESVSVGGITTDDIEAVVITPTASWKTRGEEILGVPGEASSPFDLGAVIALSRYRDEQRDTSDVQIIINSLTQDVELHNPSMTRGFVETVRAKDFEGIDTSFIEDGVTTPYEAILQASLQSLKDDGNVRILGRLEITTDEQRQAAIRAIEGELQRITSSRNVPDALPAVISSDIPRPKYPRQPPAHAMTGLAEEKFGQAKTWDEFRQILAETDIVFLDYETTGIVFDEFGRPSSNGKPTQIGAVRMRDGQVVERFNLFVNPGIQMSEWEQWSRENLVDGDGNPLTDAFFEDKPSIAEAHRQLIDFIGEGTILGMQNAVFDETVLTDALKESNIEWVAEGIIDTKEMASMALPRWTPESPDGPNRIDPRTGETVASNGLADITKYLGVDLGDKHHSADYDAEATGNVLTAIVDGAIERGWSLDFLDKDKRDEKLRINNERFEREVGQFEIDQAKWFASQGIPEDGAIPDEMEPRNADEAIRRFLQQVETGSLPYQLDENEIAEEIYQIRQSFADDTTAEVSAILTEPISITDDQEQAITQVDELISVIRGLGTDIDEDEFIYRYATDPDTIDLRSTDDPWSAPGRRGDIIRILPREVTGRDGSTYGIKPDLVEIENSGRILIEGLIVDGDGVSIGEFSRSLEVDKDGKLVASHAVLDISGDYRDKGIGSGFNNQMELVYRRLGVDRIEVSASSTIRYEGDEKTPMDIQRGVSFWPRQGFDWKDERGPETAIALFGRLFKDGGDEPDPDRVYIEGLSEGEPPFGADRFDVAYFSSKEEWESFAQSFAQLKDVDFDDPGRPVAGDFMRWAGADEWVARRTAGYSPTYVKRLDSPGDDVDIDRSVNDVVARRKEATAEQRQAISQVSTVINESLTSGKGIPSRLDFGSVSLDTESELAEEGAEPDDATSFGIQMIKMFRVETQARDGSTIQIMPDEITTNFGQNGQRAFYVRGVIQGESGVVGRFERTIRTKRQEDGSLVLYVEHDSLNVSAQGQGIGTAFNAELEKVYRELGVSYIETNAVSGGGLFGNRYIGATHWPRAGFDWSDDFSKSEYIRVLDYLMEPDPDTEEMLPTDMAYVEGLSSGPSPLPGTGRRQIAYFGSVDEWENFVEAMEQARGESLDDENRIVAGDLVRWEGADDYFAGGEFAFDLIKRLTEE